MDLFAIRFNIIKIINDYPALKAVAISSVWIDT